MPRIRFTADPKLPRDWADKPYRKDYEAEVSADEAERWLRRGVAVVVSERSVKAKAPVAAAPKEPEKPVAAAAQAAPPAAGAAAAPAAEMPLLAAAPVAENPAPVSTKDTPAKL